VHRHGPVPEGFADEAEQLIHIFLPKRRVPPLPAQSTEKGACIMADPHEFIIGEEPI
jgi:hypothetical protein